MIKVIKEGNPEKQGNAHCPKCHRIVLIPDHHISDPYICPNCNIPYRKITSNNKTFTGQ